MSISSSKIIGFIPSVDLNEANKFYSELLGLRQINIDEYAIEYEINQAKLRVVNVNDSVRAKHTIFGWEVADIHSVVKELQNKKINFIFYEGMGQNENGIATFPNGGKVAWFKDPDDNILSITQQ